MLQNLGFLLWCVKQLICFPVVFLFQSSLDWLGKKPTSCFSFRVFSRIFRKDWMIIWKRSACSFQGGYQHKNIVQVKVIQAVSNKAQKQFWGSNGIRSHDLRDTGAMLYQSRWSLRIFLGFVCNCLSYFITARITFTCIYSLSAVHSYDLYHMHIRILYWHQES